MTLPPWGRALFLVVLTLGASLLAVRASWSTYAAWTIEFDALVVTHNTTITQARNYANGRFCSVENTEGRVDTGRFDQCAEARATAQRSANREAFLELLASKGLCGGNCLTSSTFWINLIAAVAAVSVLGAVAFGVLTLLRFMRYLDAQVRDSYSLPHTATMAGKRNAHLYQTVNDAAVLCYKQD